MSEPGERAEPESPEERPRAAPPEDADGSDRGPKQIYLRTIYTLNPGIPHFLDYPQAW